jgi:hypothetical protein
LHSTIPGWDIAAKVSLGGAANMGALSVRAIILALMAFVAGGLVQAQTQRPPVGGFGSPADAMIFYVAHGAADACGQGCSEWIAAEGTVQWDTHKRLIAILDRQAGRKLPVVIHSWGESNLNVATSLGRILRGRGIDTTEGTTEVEACNGKNEAECFALKRPGGPLDAKMNLSDPRCDLACVLMLAGGVHRSLPPGTRMTLSSMFIRNRLALNVPDEHREGLTARFGEQFRMYLRDMGIETELLDIVDRNSDSRRQIDCHRPSGSGCGSSRRRRRNLRGAGSLCLKHGLRANASRFSRGPGPTFPGDALKQPEIAQFAAQRLRHRRDAGGGLAEIRRHGILGQITPALERPHRPRRHRDHLGLHHQPASSDPVAVAKWLDRDEFFARRDFSPDHPVKRATRQQFLAALRRHPRDMNVMTRQTPLLRGQHALGDPAFEFLDGFAADGELDEMKRHDFRS